MKEINGVWVYDTLDELVAPDHTALVLVDMQNDFCHPEGHFARYGKDVSSVQAVIPIVSGFVAEAQRIGMPVFFIRQETLPDGRSDSAAWLRFKGRDGKAPNYTIPDSWGWQFVDGVAPGPNDFVVPKFRPDGFHQTNLDILLRANGIETVVILGVITEGCVESTVRSASYHDYYVVVPTNAVASPNKANHEGSMRLFEARYVTPTTEDLLAVWRQAEPPRRAGEAS